MGASASMINTNSNAGVNYQTSASTQSAQSETFTFKVNDGTVDSTAATISLDLRTDPLYQYQWHLNNTGQTNFASFGGTSGADLNVDTAIVSGITGSGIIVAVLDQGLELSPILSLPGFVLSFIVIDVLHAVDLGVAADVVGSFFL